MDELLSPLPSREQLLAFLSAPSTWQQFGIVAAGALLAWLIGSWLQRRLSPVIRPGALTGTTRTAMRTGVLALVPLMLWAMLLAVTAWMRRRGLPVDVLQPAKLLVGALALIRMGVFVLRHSFSPGSRLKAWEGALTATIWSLVALHILGWLPFIEEILNEYAVTFGDVRISIYTVVSFALFVALWLLVALWLSNAMHWRLMKSTALDDSLKIAIAKLAKFALLTLAVLGSMIAAGIDLTAFAVFGGALGVGLGLGLQRVVSNFVSGVILAFEGSVRLGDIINVGNNFGTVKALHARHAVVHTGDGLDILVPNESLLTSDITNWTYDADRKVRLRLPVQLSYQDDPARAMTLMVEIARRHPRVLAEPAPDAMLLGFGDNGLNYELRVWVDNPERGAVDVRSDLNATLWRELQAAGMSFPFPQRDVRLLTPAPATVPSAGTPGSRPGSARGRRRTAPAARKD